MLEKERKKRKKWKVKALIAALVAGGVFFFILLAQREAIAESLLTWYLRGRGFEEVMLRVGTVDLSYLEVESLSFKHGDQKFSSGDILFTYAIRELLMERRLRKVRARNFRIAISLPFEPEDQPDPTADEEIVLPPRLPFDILQLVDSHLSVSLNGGELDIFISMEIDTVSNESGRAIASGEGILPGVGASFVFRQNLDWSNQGQLSVFGMLEVPSFYLDSKSLANVGGERGDFIPGYDFEGWVSLEGRTSWRAGEGDVAGTATFREFSARDEARDFEVKGISTVLEVASLKNFSTLSGQELWLSSFRAGGLQLENATVVFDIESAEWIHVQSVYLEWAGGIVFASPFSFRLNSPDFVLTLDVENIGLDRILELIPDFPARGEGRLEGRLSVHIEPDGFDLQPGNLQLMAGTRGRLQIDQPGLLTGGMSPDHPDFERRTMAETALRNVEFSRFSVTLFPEDEPGTALIMEFIAEPVEDSRIREVPVSLYLHADIRQLLRIGTRARIQVE